MVNNKIQQNVTKGKKKKGSKNTQNINAVKKVTKLKYEIQNAKMDQATYKY